MNSDFQVPFHAIIVVDRGRCTLNEESTTWCRKFDFYCHRDHMVTSRHKLNSGVANCEMIGKDQKNGEKYCDTEMEVTQCWTLR